MKIMGRWVLALPAAFAAALLAGITLRLVFYWGIEELLPVEGSTWEPWLLRVFQSLICPAAFILGGVEVAPRLKFRTSLVLAALYITLAIRWVQGLIYPGSTVVMLVASVISVSWAVFMIHSGELDEDISSSGNSEMITPSRLGF